MAPQADPAIAGDRRVLVVALALLGGVTGAVFGRVFLGTHPALRLAAAGVLAVLIAAVLARRPLALSLLASGAGLLVALGVLVFPGTTWAGVPTPDTIEALLRSLDVVTERAATEVAPAPPLAPLMTAALMAVWSAATAAHALSVRSGSSVLPLLPAAALLAFSGVVTEDPPRPGYVLLFLAASFAVLFAEAAQRTSSWGPASSRSRTIFSGRWARVLGVAAALSAVAIPGVLPGYAGKGLLDIGGPPLTVGVNPIVDIRPSLLQNPPADLFRVRANRPAYWRLVVLDYFDGRAWRQSNPGEEAGRALLIGTEPLGPISPGDAMLQQEVEIQQLGAPWLPMAPDPVEVTLEDDLGARYLDATGMIEMDAETSEGMNYAVTSAVPRPSLPALDAVMPRNPNSDPRYTALPASLPPRIRELALEIAGTTETPFDQMIAIQEHLRTFTYDEAVPPGHGSDAILDFLETTRRGYCEQFAGTMAVLVRALGYPARVAIGFLPGDLDRSGRHRVTTAQVHAWPEVHFGEYGWLAFEPTPTRANPTANYLVRLPTAARPDANLTLGRQAEPSATAFLERREGPQAAPGEIEPPAARQPAGAQPFPWRRILLAALGMAAAVVLLVIPPAKAIGRRLALSQARDSRRRVLAAYAWLLDGASDLGLGRRSWETPMEYGLRLQRQTEEVTAADAIDRITVLAGGALYSSRGPRQVQGEEAVDAARSVLRDLRRQAGPLRTLAGALRPPSP
jgi:transglutaminase-like putative cysteine protease